MCTPDPCSDVEDILFLWATFASKCDESIEAGEDFLLHHPECVTSKIAGKSLLHFIVSMDDWKANVFTLLVKNGANIALLDSSGRSLLSAAVLHRNIEAVKHLLLLGASVDQTDEVGRTPLHYASSAYSAELIELLCSAGADANAEDDMGRRPIHEVLTFTNWDIDSTERDCKARLAALNALLRNGGNYPTTS